MEKDKLRSLGCEPVLKAVSAGSCDLARGELADPCGSSPQDKNFIPYGTVSGCTAKMRLTNWE